MQILWAFRCNPLRAQQANSEFVFRKFAGQQCRRAILLRKIAHNSPRCFLLRKKQRCV
ncbi:MAG: hypothetical protein LBK13_05860 [Spirochaetales bacterium]|nr:hypothetical protein [Spirochaetales bacterium]